MSDEMTRLQVVDYLSNHPDFFQEHLELLEKMHIPHPSGNAISLVAKQLELFRSRHQEQENQLNALVAIARENDAAFSRMHELTLAMLEANSLQDAVANLRVVLAECFFTDFVAIKIVNSDRSMPSDDIFVMPDDVNLKHFAQEMAKNEPKCGRPTLAQARFLFAENAVNVRSCAIIPMAFTQLDGLLAIGSRDELRFHYSMGSLFLIQMSEIIGTRLISLLRDVGE